MISSTSPGLPSAVVDLRSVRDDAPLVARLRSGDVSAFAEAYDRHHVHVRAFARRFLGDDATAEDLVQETFLALAGAVGRFREDSSLQTFVLSVALNHARRHLRAARRRRLAAARLANEPLPAMESPDIGVSRTQLAAVLLRALDALPIDQRAAVVLCDVEDRTSAEAALIVGAPEATVRTRLFHARRKLREILAGEGWR
jgi:RNA polymerase sigma-70 factor (ECF subfamily)